METKNIYQRLADSKAKIGKISKDSKNPFFKSNYLSLNGLIEAVEPLLEENGLLLLQPIEHGNVTTQIINIEDSEMVASSIAIPQITDPQKLGSAITYFRRYTLQSLLGLQAEDDDGNSAAKPPPQKKESDDKPWLNVGSKEWIGALEKESSLESLRAYFKISKANAEQYVNALTERFNP